MSKIRSILVMAVLASLIAPANSQPYSIDWHKTAGGGGTTSGGPYILNGTVGQTDAGGQMDGGTFSLTGGFWSLIAVVQTGPRVAGQSVIGQWPVDEGSGTNLVNTSPDDSNWSMAIYGDPSLWGYWQPGAYAFAIGGYAMSAETATAAWRSGDTLTLTAKFNVTGNLHNPGQVFAGGGVFGADYFIPGGNSLGYNYGAFYAQVLTPAGGTPTIEFDVSYVPPGLWSQALPSAVTNGNINGGWNTAQWIIQNNVAQNSMVLQFGLNGIDVGAPINISGGYLEDFTTVSGYQGTVFEIGACAKGYQTFNGTLEDVSLVATVPAPVLGVRTSGFNVSVTIAGVPGWTYGIQSVDDLA